MGPLSPAPFVPARRTARGCRGLHMLDMRPPRGTTRHEIAYRLALRGLERFEDGPRRGRDDIVARIASAQTARGPGLRIAPHPALDQFGVETGQPLLDTDLLYQWADVVRNHRTSLSAETRRDNGEMLFGHSRPPDIPNDTRGPSTVHVDHVGTLQARLR